MTSSKYRSGLSAADALTIFGDRGGPAILALVENNSRLRELTGELKNVDGEAKRMAETMRDTLTGDVKTLQSAISDLVISLGDMSGGALRGSVQSMTSAVRALAANLGDVINALTLAGTVALAKFAGPTINAFTAATAAQAAYSSAVLRGKVVTLDSAQAELQKATAVQAGAAAELKKAQAAQASTAAEVANWRAVVQSTKSEIELEAVRLKSQISAQGRAASVNRLAAARLELAAATRGLSSAEASNAAAMAATSKAATVAAASQTSLAAATRGATLAARAAAGAATFLRGALAFLGGPAGLIITVASAFLIFSNRADQATKSMTDFFDEAGRRKSIQELQEKIKETTAEIERLSERAGLANGRMAGSFKIRVDEAKAKLKELQDELDAVRGKSLDGRDLFEEWSPKLFEEFGENISSGVTDETEKARESLRDLSQQIKQQADTFGMAEPEILAYRLSLGDLSSQVKLLGAEGQELARTIIANAEAFERAQNAEELANSFNKVTQELQLQRSALQQTERAMFIYNASAQLSIEETDKRRRAVEELAGALFDEQKAVEAAADVLESIKTPYDEYIEQLRKIKIALEVEEISQEQASKARIQAAKDLEKATKDSADKVTEFWKEAAKNIQNEMADNLFDVMQGEFEFTADGFKRMLDRMVADAIAADIAGALFPKSMGGEGGGSGLLGGLFEGAASLFSNSGTDFVSSSGFAPQSGGSDFFGGIADLFSFDGGGFTGTGSRSGGMDGQGGFLAMMHPNETVIDHEKGQKMGGDTNITIQVNGIQDSNGLRRTTNQIAMQAGQAVSRAQTRNG